MLSNWISSSPHAADSVRVAFQVAADLQNRRTILPTAVQGGVDGVYMSSLTNSPENGENMKQEVAICFLLQNKSEVACPQNTLY